MSEESKKQTAQEIIEAFEAVEQNLVLRDSRPAGDAPLEYLCRCKECGAGLYRKMDFCGSCYREGLAGLLPSQIRARKIKKEA